ncbi:Uncharacterised protein [Vibrio cholerae]|nr:Uncharacterised protein [Vibrio cholerae]
MISSTNRKVLHFSYAKRFDEIRSPCYVLQ